MAWPVRPTAWIYRTPWYRQQRDALVKRFRPGDPCCLCGHPITTARYVEAQHVPGTQRLQGLAHGNRNRCPHCGACNQNDGKQRNPRAAQRNPRPNPLARQGAPPPRRWVV